jgi:hypothetical protein
MKYVMSTLVIQRNFKDDITSFMDSPNHFNVIPLSKAFFGSDWMKYVQNGAK